ncbi:unnamed protein product [Chondrus crispus]|uniref:Uncharacterized protein n=1 Tax=Chondrus crispus TaxID=2769 RepID=R7QCC7_CHOCR|nr:unnamed protein product [Chondrus crispus]CDF35061.1 unnamed protein product [Chondrus crispus]|eukprot:XP_005714880.1 unnamed protein product [Chondrus crispus]
MAVNRKLIVDRGFVTGGFVSTDSSSRATVGHQKNRRCKYSTLAKIIHLFNQRCPIFFSRSSSRPLPHTLPLPRSVPANRNLRPSFTRPTAPAPPAERRCARPRPGCWRHLLAHDAAHQQISS